MKRFVLNTAALVVGGIGIWVCAHQPSDAPLSNKDNPMATPAASTSLGIYNWPDVPTNQRILVSRATFDQGGFQIYSATGEIIIVPFAGENLAAMKFGRANAGQMVFVNEGPVPTLYLPASGYLENAAMNSQTVRWYPIPAEFAYSQPVYVTLAPNWKEWTSMGWYPGMAIFGGLSASSPTGPFTWMPGYGVNIDGTRYASFANYRSYYTSHTANSTKIRLAFNYGAPRASSAFGAFGSNSAGISGGGSSTHEEEGATGTTGATGAVGATGSPGATGASGEANAAPGGVGVAGPSDPLDHSGDRFGGATPSAFGSHTGPSSGAQRYAGYGQGRSTDPTSDASSPNDPSNKNPFGIKNPWADPFGASKAMKNPWGVKDPSGSPSDGTSSDGTSSGGSFGGGSGSSAQRSPTDIYNNPLHP